MLIQRVKLIIAPDHLEEKLEYLSRTLQNQGYTLRHVLRRLSTYNHRGRKQGSTSLQHTCLSHWAQEKINKPCLTSKTSEYLRKMSYIFSRYFFTKNSKIISSLPFVRCFACVFTHAHLYLHYYITERPVP